MLLCWSLEIIISQNFTIFSRFYLDRTKVTSTTILVHFIINPIAHLSLSHLYKYRREVCILLVFAEVFLAWILKQLILLESLKVIHITPRILEAVSE